MTPETPLTGEEPPQAKKVKRKNLRLAITQTCEDIEKEIDDNGGTYPRNNGVISTAEVLRQAGVSPAALQKLIHGDLRDHTKILVAKLRARLKSKTSLSTRTKSVKVNSTGKELAELRQRWLEAELEYLDTVQQIQKLRQRCAELEHENDRLKDELSLVRSSAA